MLGTIRRCRRSMTLATLCHFRSTPDHCDSCVLLAMAGELVLGTVRRCGRFGVLAARLRFGSMADLYLSHVRLCLYMGVGGFWIFYCYFGPELSLSSLRCRPCELFGAPCLYPRPGVGWKLNRCRLTSYALLPGRIVTTLPFAIQGFRLGIVFCGKDITRIVYTFPVLPAYIVSPRLGLP